MKILNKTVVLHCATESGVDNAGFYSYRSETESGEYLKINEDLITAEGSTNEGASYEFVDTEVQNRKTYYYKLEIIDLNGNSALHGLVSATPRFILGVLKTRQGNIKENY